MSDTLDHNIKKIKAAIEEARRRRIMAMALDLDTIEKTAKKVESVQDLLKALGFEIKEEHFVKDDVRIAFHEVAKHTPQTFAEKLKREINK